MESYMFKVIISHLSKLCKYYVNRLWLIFLVKTKIIPVFCLNYNLNKASEQRQTSNGSETPKSRELLLNQQFNC
jgi:hypothetical protein